MVVVREERVAIEYDNYPALAQNIFSNLVIFSGFFSFSCNSKNSSVSSPGSPPGNNKRLCPEKVQVWSLHLHVSHHPVKLFTHPFNCATTAYLNDPFIMIICAESKKSWKSYAKCYSDFTDLPHILLLQ